MSKVAIVDEIIDPEFKKGVTKKGKKEYRWVLVKVRAGGKEATGFGPVVEGDVVKLIYNEEFDNFKFELTDELPDIESEEEDAPLSRPETQVEKPTDYERSKGITANMALKIAIIEWVKVEGRLPRSSEERSDVEEIAKWIFDASARITSEKAPEKPAKKLTTIKEKLDKGFSEEESDFEEELEDMDL